MIKIKSLTTDEIKLNAALGKAGIQAVETDLAELIIQLAGEHSSHILVPAIHKNRAEIRGKFYADVGRDGTFRSTERAEPLLPAPIYGVNSCQRRVISGANFAVAETGTVVLSKAKAMGACV